MKKIFKNLHQHIGSIVTILIGFLCGMLLVHYNTTVPKDHLWEELIWPFGLLLILYVAMMIHMIIHEAGHLICGLVSGYRFSSFRIMSLMIIKVNERFQIKKLAIAGTGGQCLMSPPEIIDGKLPVLLYNLGGPIANLLVGLLFMILYFTLPLYPFLAASVLIFAFVGFIFAFLNGIPMRMRTVNNDGYNAYSMQKNPEAIRAFWIQMKINESISKGLRLKHMPEDWFYMPNEEAMHNSMVAVMGVFACNRLLDQHKFKEAEQSMAQILDAPCAIVGLHRNLMLCDRLYLELIGQNSVQARDALYADELKNFMRTMRNFPSVLRTQYAYALLAENDLEASEKILGKFNKAAKAYPYPQEISAEREYMLIAKEKYTYSEQADH